MTSDFEFALDPVAWAETIGFTPDAWQKDFLRSSVRRVLLNCSRQSGKSSISALLAAHRALFYPSSLVLVVSPSERQSGELFRMVNGFLDRLHCPPRKTEDLKTAFKLENESRVIALPGSETTVRGFAGVDLLIIDEAARVSDDLIKSLSPMLAVSGGRLVLLSTPFGKRGYFFDEWTTGGTDWFRFQIPASECPRISPAFLEQERRSLGEWHYLQEYCCEFSETRDAVFGYDCIMAALSDEITPLFSEALTGGTP